jgi:hypothetical protein
MGNTDQELEELEALCEEWEYYTNQESEFDYV